MTTHPDASRAAYYARIAEQRLAPLWESLHNLVPTSRSRPRRPRSGNTRRCATS